MYPELPTFHRNSYGTPRPKKLELSSGAECGDLRILHAASWLPGPSGVECTAYVIICATLAGETSCGLFSVMPSADNTFCLYAFTLSGNVVLDRRGEGGFTGSSA